MKRAVLVGDISRLSALIRPCVVVVILVTFHLILNVGSIELLTSQSITLPDTAKASEITFHICERKHFCA